MARAILDLCAGTGSATDLFAAAGWQRVKVDNEPRHNPDVLADVLTWRPGAERYDVIWASPPCTYFSRYDQRSLFPNEPEPDTAIAEACWRIIQEQRPAVWWIENVRGARRFFAPFLGPPTCHLGPWWLWTNSRYLPALAERPKKRMSGYRRGSIPNVRLKLAPVVAAELYRVTTANFAGG